MLKRRLQLSHVFKLCENEGRNRSQCALSVTVLTFELDFLSLDCLLDMQGDTDRSSILLASKPVCNCQDIKIVHLA